MRQELIKVIDEFKEQIEAKVISIVGPRGRVLRGQTVCLTEYDSICDDVYGAPFKILKFIVEGERVLVRTEDEDGDRDEVYLRDFPLGDIQQIISIL